MKVNELLQVNEMKTKGAWNIANLSGVNKNFKDSESPDALAWMRNRGNNKQIWDKVSGRWIEDQKSIDRELKKADRENTKADREEARAEREANRKAKSSEIYAKVSDAIGTAFPDADPVDYWGAWAKKNNVDMEDIDRAFRKHQGGGCKGYYDYLATMWEDMAGDAMHDAVNNTKAGEEYDSPFIDYKDGKPTIRSNPWMSHDEQTKYRAKRMRQHLKGLKVKKVAEGVLGSDVRDKDELPDAKFDYEAWRANDPSKKFDHKAWAARKQEKKTMAPRGDRFADVDGIVQDTK